MAERIRVGIVGAGWAGDMHAKTYQAIPDVEIVGWADVVPDKAARAAAARGLPPSVAYLDYRDMFERVPMDAVSVCTFNMGHREPTVDALGLDKHVLLEKPMAATLEDARAIMRAADQSRGILMVAFQSFFTAEHTAARKIVASGALGEIYYAEAVTHRRWGIPGGNFLRKSSAGAGALVDIGVYPIHAAMTLMGNPSPVRISAIAESPLAKRFKGVQKAFSGEWTADDVEVEEFAVGFVRFDNGAVLVVKAAWAGNIDSQGRSYFLGTMGGLALNPLELYVNQQIDDLNLTATPRFGRIADDWGDKVRAFVAAVRDGRPSPIDRRGVFLVNVIMDGMLRSAEAGHEVAVDAGY